jgi:hypothetical protein
MAKRSIRKLIAIARREAYKALKFHIKGMMWFDTVTVDTHHTILSDDYMQYFWSHLVTACNSLRPLEVGEICATPKEVSLKLTGSVNSFAGSWKVTLPHSEFFLKHYDYRLSCGPSYPGSTVLNVRTDDIAQMIVAYDHEMERRDAVATNAIHECNAEAVALDIALTTARALADDIINREKIEIRADQAGASRIQYTIQLMDKPFVETEFWASMSEFKPRLLRAIRNLHHKERELYL